MMTIGYSYTFTRLKFTKVTDLLIDIITQCRIDLRSELSLYCDGSLVLDVAVINKRSCLELKPIDASLESFCSQVKEFTRELKERIQREKFELRNGD